MEHPTSLTLHAHWTALRRDALRAGRSAPARDAVDPAAIRGVLASAFVLDLGPRPGDAAFGLSGTRLDALFGRPLRGTAFRRLWSPQSWALALSTLHAALGATSGTTSGAWPSGGRPAAARARGGPPGCDAAEFELLLLPLEGGRHALGALAPFAAPGWLGLAAAAPLQALPPGSRCTPDRGGFGRRRAVPRPGPGATAGWTLPPAAGR